MNNLFFYLVAFAIASFLVLLVFLFLKERKKKIKLKQIKVGDIVTLQKGFHANYPGLPSNNPFTVVGFENSKVQIKYIHFKNITIHHETVERDAIRKIS